MASLPTLTKRVFDNRALSVDVSKKLRSGDMVSSFESISAEVLSTRLDSVDDAEALGVFIDSSSSITDGKILNFRCSGGSEKTSYVVSLRYTTDDPLNDDGVGEMLESIIRVNVI